MVDKKVTTAEIPPIGIIFILFSIALLIKTPPGSEIKGVPASETRAREFPSFKNSIREFVFSHSENL